MSKWLRRWRYRLMIGIGLIAVYLAAALGWHHEDFDVWFIGHWPNPSPARTAVLVSCDRVLVNFYPLFHPLRPRKDPEGHAYFPPEEDWHGRNGCSSSGAMRRLGEPSLFQLPADRPAGPVFRLTLSPPFGGKITSCRIYQTESAGDAVEARFAQIDPQTGRLLAEATIPFPAEKWDQIISLATSGAFWDSFSDYEDTLISSTLDGTEWRFEFRHDADYRIIRVPSPDFLCDIVLQLNLTPGSEQVRDLRNYATVGRLIAESSPFPIDGFDLSPLPPQSP